MEESTVETSVFGKGYGWTDDFLKGLTGRWRSGTVECQRGYVNRGDQRKNG